MSIRPIAAAIAATAVLTAGVLAATPPAAAGTPAESVTAAVASGPFAVQIQASRPANAPATAATGTFTAHVALGGLPLFTLHGPVTCLDVRGNRMGLFYPITSSDPSVFAQLGSGVFIYLQVSAAGKPQLLGFVPSPLKRTNSCAPGLALFPITSRTATLSP